MSRPTACRYCGDEAHGPGCMHSPDGYHESIGDNDHCVRCGSTSYGPGCMYPEKGNLRELHIHGHGVSAYDGEPHCIYCGDLIGRNGNPAGPCMYSPTGRHVG